MCTSNTLIESMRVEDLAIPLLQLHLDRIFYSIQILDWSIGHKDIQELKTQIEKYIIKNCQEKKSYKLRLEIAYNSNKNDIITTFNINNIDSNCHLPIRIANVASLPPTQYPKLKCSSNLDTIFRACNNQRDILTQTLLVNEKDELIETNFGNIFLVINNSIYTPNTQNLYVEGCCRKYIFNNYHLFDYPLIERVISIHELANATSIFVSNAVRGIMPVSTINNISYNLDSSKDTIIHFNNTIFK